MKPAVTLVVVVPIGPTCCLEFILDTLASVQYYVHSSYAILIADDSQSPALAAAIKQQVPAATVLANAQRHGKGLGLYVSLCRAYQYALDTFNFEALLRLDTDALVTGHDPELPALALFQQDPMVGLAGRYVRGLHSPDDFGNIWDNRVAREVYTGIFRLTSRHFLRQPLINWRIRALILRASRNGYDLGDLIFGGAYIFSRRGLEALRDQGFLPVAGVQPSPLDEDHFFSMLVVAAGMRLGDLASGNLPFGVTWVGLPAAPQMLAAANKKIIHSIRSWGTWQEADIRQFFQNQRVPAPNCSAVLRARK